MKRQEITTSLLPAGYRQLEYIESSGGQYIDIPVQFYANKQAVIEWIMTHRDSYPNYSPYNNWHGYLFGCSVYGSGSTYKNFSSDYYSHSSNNNVTYASTISGNATSGGYGVKIGTKTWVMLSTTQKHSQYLENGEWVDLSPLSTLNRPIRQNFNGLRLFDANIGNRTRTYPLTLHWFKITVDNVEVVNLVPALRTSDSKPGLYDTLNNQFYINQGTGEFLYN